MGQVVSIGRVSVEIINRYESPAMLALVSNSPEPVCRLVFAAGKSVESIKAIRSDSREGPLCELRCAIVWVAREYAGATFRPIGRALNRDGSVTHRCYVQAKRLRRRNKPFRAICDELIGTLARREIVRTSARRALQRQAAERLSR